MSEEVLSEFQEIDLDEADLERGNRVKTVLYNGMIHPLLNFRIKGVLWYQGESNRTAPDEYLKLFPAMVKDWRERWGIGDFPFYYVQIAPFNYNGVNSAFLREAQLKSLDEIPNAGMAVTMDIGKEYFIHPPRKKEVADRLLYIALKKTYGFDRVDDSGPIYKSYEVQDSGIMLTFTNAENGLYTEGGLMNFEIAGADKVFHQAEARIVNQRNVFVKSPDVDAPVAVRYAWENWVEGTLYDSSLLPASSFRTDDWPIEDK
jgi:sialate O-acetylesterase